MSERVDYENVIQKGQNVCLVPYFKVGGVIYNKLLLNYSNVRMNVILIDCMIRQMTYPVNPEYCFNKSQRQQQRSTKQFSSLVNFSSEYVFVKFKINSKLLV